MNALDVLRCAQSFAAGRAVRSAGARDYHLQPDPYLLAVLRFGGERFRLSAALLARASDAPEQGVTIVYDHQDTDHYLVQVHPFLSRLMRVLKEGHQIVVPNPATVSALWLLGRSLVALRPRDGLRPGEHRFFLAAGRALMDLADQAKVPSQSLLLPLTEVMARHWALLSAPSERGHLESLDAEIEPPVGKSATQAAFEARARALTCGPNLHASTEQSLTTPRASRARSATAAKQAPKSPYALVRLAIEESREYGEDFLDPRSPAAQAYAKPLSDQLLHARALMARCVQRELELPQAPSAQQRWESDARTARAIHDRAQKAQEGVLRRVREDALGAARTFARREHAEQLWQSRRAFDDPMVMAGRVMDGTAVQAVVVSTEVPEGAPPSITVREPLQMMVRCEDPGRFERGDEIAAGYGKDHLVWKVRSVELREEPGGQEESYLLHLSATGRRALLVHHPGDQVVFAPREPVYIPLPVPEVTPWVYRDAHQAPAISQLDGGDHVVALEGAVAGVEMDQVPPMVGEET